MVATPSKGQTDPNYALQQQINDLKRQVTNLANKTLYSATIGSGGVTVENGGSLTIETGGGITIPVGGSVLDSAGHTIIEADPVGGVAYPQFPVPLYGSVGGNFFATPANNQGYAGYLSKIVSPRLTFFYQFGPFNGATSMTTTFNLYTQTGGLNLVATLLTQTEGINAPFQTQTWDITPYFNRTDLFFYWICTASAGTGQLLMQPYGLFQVGTI